MVCAKCQKLQRTTLATPNVKRKNEMYYGSPAAAGVKDKSRTSATAGSTGVGKVRGYIEMFESITDQLQLQSKLLSKSAKNPYAAYASSCTTCKTKTDEGKKYCQRCAYKANGGPKP